jgi:protein TonB
MAISSTQRWTALGSLTFQLAVAALLFAIPLVRPQLLPTISTAPHLELPLPMRPPVPVVQTRPAAGSATHLAVPAAAQQAAATQRLVFQRLDNLNAEPAPALGPNLPFGMGGPGGGTPEWNAISTGSGPAVPVIRAKAPGPVNVSGGVTEGMLLAPIHPVYPAIARAAGIQGAVVMEAMISKAGRIESLRVLSGPEMLQRSAMDAVQAARYRPYLLSGVPTEVQTTITVVFKLGS